jgi:hypothetical protein
MDRPGAFPPGVSQQFSELLRRMQALEARSLTGLGVSTSYGAKSLEVRATQVGFPAELTSVWDTSTGYSWKQLALAGVSVGDPDTQRTGDKAVTVDNNTALEVGTLGWLEVDPQAGGCLFTPVVDNASIAADVYGTPTPPATGQQTQWVGLTAGAAGATDPATASNPIPVYPAANTTGGTSTAILISAGR